MKILNILMLSSVMLLLASCYKDHSNYDYTQKEVITITGIDSFYNKLSQKDDLIIKPVVTTNMPNPEFEYFWGIYENNAPSGYLQPFDTLTKSKDLEMLVNRDAKDWVLIFGAKNKKTGFTQLTSSILKVATDFTRGWYVLKDDGINSDLDLHTNATSIIPNQVWENVYSQMNGKKLAGKGVNICFDSRYKSMNGAGSYGATRAMYVLSDQDASVLNVNNLKAIHDFDGLFYSAPTTKSPNAMMVASGGNYFINNGNMHSLNNIYSSIGLFGNNLLWDINNTHYEASKYYLTHNGANPYIFDNVSSTFKYVAITGQIMTAVADASSTQMKSSNNNKKALYIGLKANSPFTGIAIFQDKSNPAIKLLTTITPSTTAFRMVNDTISTASKLYNASMYTVNFVDENLIYFVVNDREVWSRNLSNGFEQLQYTAAAGETITYLRHKKYTAETAFAYNYVMVGTQAAGKYKLHMFTKSAGNLATTPAFTLTGNGSVKDVYYLSPSVTNATYMSSY